MTVNRVDRINGLVGSIAVKAPCKVATTENITLSGAQTIDGVLLTADASPRQRVLVKDQTDDTENGIYDVNSGTWTRSPDFDGSRDAVDGTQVLVNEGADPLTRAYELSATNPVDIGTDSLTFTRVPGYGSELEDDPTPTLAGDLDMSIYEIEGVSATEMSYVAGVTSAIQTQLDANTALIKSTPNTYDASIDYMVNSVVIGSDGAWYEALIANGPGTSVVDPVADGTGTWVYARRGLPGFEINLGFEPTATQLIQMQLLARDGSSLLDADYPDLLAAWGDVKLYGNVDGTHFNLMDDSGLFERIWDDGAGVDPNAATRTDRGDGTGGDEVGTTQADGFEAHVHTQVMDATGSAAEAGANARTYITGPSNTGSTGGDETRPTNRYKWGGVFY